MHVSHNRQIQRAYFSGDRLVVCLNDGGVEEHKLELLESERLVTGSYRSHRVTSRTQHIFCDPVYHNFSQDERIPITRDLKCWTVFPHIVYETTSLKLDFHVVNFNLAANRPISVVSSSSDPRSDFRLRPSHFPLSMRPAASPISRIAKPLRRHKDYYMVPRRWLPGKSTLLTQLHVQDPDLDILLLSYASPPKSSLPNNAKDKWLIKYQPIRTYTSDGTPTSFTSSDSGLIADLLWNEYTGQIVTATKVVSGLSSTDLQIRIFEF
ncbi:hypothetical protein DL93DRAFT_2234162 [Clavulina sp. PMI_390]|nr:hypothetical protein DL93DRAFT_2234162 [Clavulina sp. PMI_390]